MLRCLVYHAKICIKNGIPLIARVKKAKCFGISLLFFDFRQASDKVVDES